MSINKIQEIIEDYNSGKTNQEQTEQRLYNLIYHNTEDRVYQAMNKRYEEIMNECEFWSTTGFCSDHFFCMKGDEIMFYGRKLPTKGTHWINGVLKLYNILKSEFNVPHLDIMRFLNDKIEDNITSVERAFTQCGSGWNIDMLEKHLKEHRYHEPVRSPRIAGKNVPPTIIQ
jgi:hypothetical protein